MKRPYGSIYLATCLVNQKQYVGQTVKIVTKRWAEYRVESKRSNRPFCNAIAKYGWENFSWKVIDVGSNQEDLNAKEIFWIAKLGTLVSNGGYNLSEGGGSTSGVTPSLETRAKMSKARLGKKLSEETRAKMKLACKGRKPSRETIEKARLVCTGRKDSEETRLKKRVASTGRFHTPETKEKMRKAHLGKTQTPEHREKNRVVHLRENRSPEGIEKCRQAALNISDENREKLRQLRLGTKVLPETTQKIQAGMKKAWARGDFDNVHKGRKASEETRRKMSEARKGRPISEEARKRLRDSVIARWKRYRESQVLNQTLSPT
jgi:group I intron endonuclease